MANEFKHKDVGDELSKAEYHAVDGHEADSQAAGDIIYCDGSYWKRLGKGANGLYLKAGSAPYWEAILESDIPATICRDSELTAHAAIAAAHHTKTIDASELSAGELPSARLATNQKLADIAFIIDGGGSAITTGQKGHLEIPFACTINRVTVLADQSGSIVVDIWKDTYANFPPADDDSITASAPPTLSSEQKSQDSTLTGWTVAIAAGDILAFNVDSVSTVERVVISLRVTKT